MARRSRRPVEHDAVYRGGKLILKKRWFGVLMQCDEYSRWVYRGLGSMDTEKTAREYLDATIALAVRTSDGGSSTVEFPHRGHGGVEIIWRRFLYNALNRLLTSSAHNETYNFYSSYKEEDLVVNNSVSCDKNAGMLQMP